jgi:hypothetical protein
MSMNLFLSYSEKLYSPTLNRELEFSDHFRLYQTPTEISYKVWSKYYSNEEILENYIKYIKANFQCEDEYTYIYEESIRSMNEPDIEPTERFNVLEDHIESLKAFVNKYNITCVDFYVS